MKKIGSFSVVLVMLVALFTGCSSSNSSPNSSPEPAEITTSVIENCSLSDMTDLSEKSIKNIFNIDTAICESYSVFVKDSGATADEVAVFKVTNGEDVDAVYNKLTDRKTDQIESFTDYVDAEIPKINNAIIKKTGNYIYLVIASDTKKAQETINKLFA